ncbi:MAG: endopeptidase La [Clostridia bacterium]|nr:endopeptidase La [Clostridia bacterium]
MKKGIEVNISEGVYGEKPEYLPVVALRGSIIFPDTTLTIYVGRDISVRAVDAGYNEGGLVMCVAQRDVSVEAPAQKDIYEIGTVCKVRQVLKMPGGNVKVLLTGLYRGHADLHFGKKYIECTVAPLIEINPDTIKAEALLRQARDLLATLVATSTKVGKELLVEIASTIDYNKFVNLVANQVVYQDEKKQFFLEEADTEVRLEELCKIINTEIEIAKLDKKISFRVKSQIDKGQKEYYLREQMKAISIELGEGQDEYLELEERIKAAKMPADVQEKAMKELKRFQKMTPSSPDATVSRAYIEWLTDLEWNLQTEDNKDLVKAKEILDEDHYGLFKIKERILEYLAVMQLTGDIKGQILCFVGPPGVGKTSIVKSIARALNRRYVRMSLGGVRDEAEIRGHRKTYVGAIPGKIIYMLKQAQCVNPVLLFDEIDKMNSDFRGDPASAMLEVLDPEQNNTFVDHYLEVPFDLSKVLFVATANTVESIPPALLDRMEIIELTGYTEEEKLQIAKGFLIPKQKAMHGLDKDAYKLGDKAIDEVISRYTRESGVRTLEREIATLSRKIALKLVNAKNAEMQLDCIDIQPSDLEEYLGVEKYKEDFLSLSDEVGSATGLAWTSVGGATLTIDVTLFKGKGDILLTGKLGDVMKESARTAISLVRTRAEEYGITADFAQTDIHIHVPEGATPKDGPSAGVTMATAILSAFSGKPVKKSVAMTGEITLRGKVLAIGGLKEKSLAAFRAGIKTIIIPAENKSDVTEIPESVRNGIKFVYADDISTVFDNAIVK